MRELLVDPHILARRASDPSTAEAWYGLGWGSGAEQYWAEGGADEKVPPPRRLLGLVGQEDRALLDLHLLQGISTRRIAILLRISQPSVCWRLARAAARLRFAYLRPPAPTNLATAMPNCPEKLSQALLAVAQAGSILQAARDLGLLPNVLRRRVKFGIPYLPEGKRDFFEYLVKQEPKHLPRFRTDYTMYTM